MNSDFICLDHFIWVILDRKSKIQVDWNKCYIVELFVGFLKMYVQYDFEKEDTIVSLIKL
jgi:hypothetical protein